jgi:hypothetical protein
MRDRPIPPTLAFVDETTREDLMNIASRRARGLVIAAAGLLCAGALLGGGTASAGKSVKWKPGSYYGQTSQGHGIFFGVTKKKAGPFGGNYTAKCGSSSMYVDLNGVPETKINKKNGKFKSNGDGPGTKYVKGRIKGKKASGTLRVAFSGCDTGIVKWTAKRTGK